ncbi:MAG: class I SAM-dependent methyltransferase [Terriglobales bacterium]
MRTEPPYWLEEAYDDAVSRVDVGLVGRNLAFAPITEMIIRCFFDPKARFLDYGGGCGLLVRLMRDCGLDFGWYDRYATNLLARGFEGNTDERYELVTAFELFEHLEDPLNEISRIFASSQNILFSTQLLPASKPKPGEWWYFALETGQHISIYSRESLRKIAQRFGVNLYSAGMLHLLTPKRISPSVFRMLCRGGVSRFLKRFVRSESLGLQDREIISQTIRLEGTKR